MESVAAVKIKHLAAVNPSPPHPVAAPIHIKALSRLTEPFQEHLFTYRM